MNYLMSIFSEVIPTMLDSFIFYKYMRKFKGRDNFIKSDFCSISFISLLILIMHYTVNLFSPLSLLIMNLFWLIWATSIKNIFKHKEILFQLLLISTIFLLIESFSLFPAQLLFDLPVKSLFSTGFHRVIVALICKLLVYNVMKHTSKVNLEHIVKNSKYFYSTSASLLLYIVSVNILTLDILDLDTTFKNLTLSASFIILIINFTILALLNFIMSFSNRYEHLSIIEENFELQKHVLREQKNNIDTIRKIQHEYKNYLTTINALLLNDNIDEAKAMLTRILDITSTVTSSIKNASFFDIIVNYKLLEAESRDIKTYNSIDIPMDMPIDNYDIAIILNNALNNALEACMNVDASSRYIKCKIFTKGRYLNFYFENSYNNNCIKEVNDQLITTKEDKNSHGFGIKNIISIVKKYNGLLKYNFFEGKYILKLSLLIPEKP